MEDFSKHFYYCEESPSCLRRVNDWRNGRQHCTLKAKAGSPAGTLDKDGYYNVNIGGRLYKAHRVVWVMHFGEIPKGMCIDHKNGLRADNRISNLRLTDVAGNNRNRKVDAQNEAEMNGVNRCVKTVDGKEYHYWTATWRDKGKSAGKNFSIEKLGDSVALECAINYRKKMIKILNDAGAGYSERHTGEIL